MTSAPRPDEPRPACERCNDSRVIASVDGEAMECPHCEDAEMVAALYVETGGTYFGLPGVDPWDETRDARLYAGPFPVVAHPPCNRWVSYGSREKRGDDGGCFAAALAAVREWGGVLEHPARSQAWSAFGLTPPRRHVWSSRLDDPGWTIEVDQHAYGFPTRKLTWLYCVGVPFDVLRPVREATRGCETLWSTERSKTPPAFAHALVAMSRSVYAARAAA